MTAYSRLQEKEFSREYQPRLRSGEASALRRHRILRRSHAGDCRRQVVSDGAGGLDRGRAVRGNEASGAAEERSGCGLPAYSRRMPVNGRDHPNARRTRPRRKLDAFGRLGSTTISDRKSHSTRRQPASRVAFVLSQIQAPRASPCTNDSNKASRADFHS